MKLVVRKNDLESQILYKTEISPK